MRGVLSTAAIALSCVTAPMFGQSFNIDLGGTLGRPTSAYGAAAGQPGVWNSIGKGLWGLSRIDGYETHVIATVTAETDTGNAAGCGGDVEQLTGDYIYSSNGRWSVALAGLTNATGLANGQYAVYLYAPYNGLLPTGPITVNGTPVPSISSHSCTITQAVTQVTTTVTDGTLTIAGKSDSFSGLAGIQLVQLSTTNEAPPWTVTTFAGPAEVWDVNPFGGTADGPGNSARFNTPFGVAADKSGNVYVADTLNHTIRKITPTGTVTTLAGRALYQGDVDGTGSAARFYEPKALAVDANGNVYVADTFNHTIRKVSAAGIVSTLAGRAGSFGSADATTTAARFRYPFGIAVDASGNVFAADTQNHTIRRIAPDGTVTTFAGVAGTPGSADGQGSAARFNFPAGLATDRDGNVYVADYANHTIRKVTPSGVVTTLAGLAGTHGAADGPGTAARFTNPAGLAIDTSGNVYVADQGNNSIRKITAGGETSTVTGSSAGFNQPPGVAIDTAGNLYVADTGNAIVSKITPDAVVTTFAGGAPSSGRVDGSAGAARFHTPFGIAYAPDGNLYVADTYNNAIRKVTPTRAVSTVARVTGPVAVAADTSGNLFVAGAWDHTIRKITPAGVVTTFAGSEFTSGSADGNGTAAQFNTPTGVAVDRSGTVYVADSQNHTIRKITAAGDVSTFAGRAGTSGSADGTVADARFNGPTEVAIDQNGNVYVSDSGNRTIRKISPAGVVSTIAGKPGEAGFDDGVGPDARFGSPAGLAVDANGNIWVADRADSIRKITPGGVVTTVAGMGIWGSADGPANIAQFNSPGGVAVDGAGNVYVADTLNDAIRVITPTLADAATIDQQKAVVGSTRILDAEPRTATSWEWSIVRQPANSSTNLSATDIRSPTFTPDVGDLYLFRLIARGSNGASVSFVELQAAQGTVRRRAAKH